MSRRTGRRKKTHRAGPIGLLFVAVIHGSTFRFVDHPAAPLVYVRFKLRLLLMPPPEATLRSQSAEVQASVRGINPSVYQSRVVSRTCESPL